MVEDIDKSFCIRHYETIDVAFFFQITLAPISASSGTVEHDRYDCEWNALLAMLY